MDAHVAVLAEASYLLQQNLYLHLEEAEDLAEKDWNEEQEELARELLSELPRIVRHTIAEHRATETVDCLTCERPWPCQVVTTVHRMVTSPDYHFVRLLSKED